MDRALLSPGLPDGLSVALALRGFVAVVKGDAIGAILCSGSSPPSTLPTLLLADLPDAEAADWLDAGHDVIRPDAAATLIAARFAALVRHRDTRWLRVGALAIDTTERRVSRGDFPLMLLPREYRLLVRLARAGGTPVTRATLLADVWGLDFEPGTNVVDVHVSRLRAKLDRGFATPMLRTDKRVGYRLVAADAAIAALAAAG